MKKNESENKESKAEKAKSKTSKGSPHTDKLSDESTGGMVDSGKAGAYGIDIPGEPDGEKTDIQTAEGDHDSKEEKGYESDAKQPIGDESDDTGPFESSDIDGAKSAESILGRVDNESNSHGSDNPGDISKLPHREIQLPEFDETREDLRMLRDEPAIGKIRLILPDGKSDEELIRFVGKKLGVGNLEGMMKKVNRRPGKILKEKLQAHLDQWLPATQSPHPDQK